MYFTEVCCFVVFFNPDLSFLPDPHLCTNAKFGLPSSCVDSCEVSEVAENKSSQTMSHPVWQIRSVEGLGFFNYTSISS